MNEVRTKCFTCKNYHVYYSRSFCNLLMERFGFCDKHCKIVQDRHFCDGWHKRRISCTQYTSLAIDSINEIYQKIATVEHMLKEEIEIEKLNKKLKD